MQMKGDDSANLHKPPNHKLFDPSDKAISPVLLRRQAALATQNPAPPPPAAPVFNMNGAFDFLRPFVPTAAVAPMAGSHAPGFSMTLLPPAHNTGPDMKIEVFGPMYELSPKIIEKHTANDYLHARYLRFILVKELEDMGFTRGEIAALRDAVETWSILMFLFRFVNFCLAVFFCHIWTLFSESHLLTLLFL